MKRVKRLFSRRRGGRGGEAGGGGGGGSAASSSGAALGVIGGSEDAVVLCNGKDSTAVENAVRLAEAVGGRGFKVQAAAKVKKLNLSTPLVVVVTPGFFSSQERCDSLLSAR